MWNLGVWNTSTWNASVWNGCLVLPVGTPGDALGWHQWHRMWPRKLGPRI
jgi:hypothetical protein